MLTGELDPQAILVSLGITEPFTVHPVHGGSDTAIWQVKQAGRLYALRVFRTGEQEDCEREQMVMQAAAFAGLPVPQVYAAGAWQGYPVLLLSWLPGRTVADELRAHPWRAWQMGVLFGRMQAAMHTIAAPDGLRQATDAWITWLGVNEPSLQERLHAFEHRNDLLLHLDYHPLNVLTDGRSITGILDWRNALAGDARADAARTVAILHVDAVSLLRLWERPIWRLFEQGWRAGYERNGGSLRDMELFYAWAGAVMELDLAHKRGPADLARIHAWTVQWKKRARCP